MKLTFTISALLLLLLALTVPVKDQIGQLKLTNAKIKKSETTIDSIAGITVELTWFTIEAKTNVQVSCNFANPEKNKYKTIENQVSIKYAYDSTGNIYKAIIQEIKDYVNEQEEEAKEYNSGPDYSHLPFNKSFYLNGTTAIPFIQTLGETTDDHKIFYIDRQVYKIELIESYGYGNLSAFLRQNSYFVKDGKPLKLGEYIKNTDKVKEILSKIE